MSNILISIQFFCRGSIKFTHKKLICYTKSWNLQWAYFQIPKLFYGCNKKFTKFTLEWLSAKCFLLYAQATFWLSRSTVQQRRRRRRRRRNETCSDHFIIHVPEEPRRIQNYTCSRRTVDNTKLYMFQENRGEYKTIHVPEEPWRMQNDTCSRRTVDNTKLYMFQENRG